MSAVGVCILAFRRKWQIMQGLHGVESLPSDIITTWHRRKGSEDKSEDKNSKKKKIFSLHSKLYTPCKNCPEMILLMLPWIAGSENWGKG